MTESGRDNAFDVAVIGLALRFPGANGPDQFWQNLREGVESISTLTTEDVSAALESVGLSPTLATTQNFVRAAAVLDGIDLFDAGFFGYTPKEAREMDPQHRLFLECAWESLEAAGYDPFRYSGAIGVYAGTSVSSYLLFNVFEGYDPQGWLQSIISNDKDYLTTRISYKFDLRGPSVAVQTACSTSLVAIHLACQGLLAGDCDIAMAGGVSIHLPDKIGYIYDANGVLSSDGHCRSFDDQSTGTVLGNGAGVVVLKRLEDAIRDRDNICAIVKGSAINNDGARKVGYTAPAVDGQAEVIEAAHAVSGVDPGTISYIEAHGTGTPLGDPIEVAALARAFSGRDARRNSCALGSVKSNVGHLDAAAGVAGFIKTVLALQHREIPPSLHFNTPNANIDFDSSGFYVNAKLQSWADQHGPRRAGVSSFGIGGTNAHVILEEAASPEPALPSTAGEQLILLSARTPGALENVRERIARHISDNPDVVLEDMAYTLQVGRAEFRCRQAIVCSDRDELLRLFGETDRYGGFARLDAHASAPDIVFMFPGQGSQYASMGRGLYDTQPMFRHEVDRCAAILAPLLGLDIRDIMWREASNDAAEKPLLDQIELTLPALFTIEYALARLWMNWGIKPAQMIGYSAGEYVAAAIAEVFSLEDALLLVSTRARLMRTTPAGAMMSVGLSEAALKARIDHDLAIAAVNGPDLCVVSGPPAAVENLRVALAHDNIEYQLLNAAHGFHSAMMETILPEFRSIVQQVDLKPPSLSYMSNLTGRAITGAEATSAEYWVNHLRRTVRFNDGLTALAQEPDRIFLEVGPGRVLGGFARQQMPADEPHTALASLRHAHEQISDGRFALTTIGKLWLRNVRVDWEAVRASSSARRIPLPTYPFERRRHWIKSRATIRGSVVPSVRIVKNPDLTEWFYAPVWQECAPLALAAPPLEGPILIFVPEGPLDAALADRFSDSGRQVIAVRIGRDFDRISASSYRIAPDDPDQYRALIESVLGDHGSIGTIVHAWSISVPSSRVEHAYLDGLTVPFFSLVFLAQVLARHLLSTQVVLLVASAGASDVLGNESLDAMAATGAAVARTMSQEYPNVSAQTVDFIAPDDAVSAREVAAQIYAELAHPSIGCAASWRLGRRWEQRFLPTPLPAANKVPAILRPQGVYLITGGLGQVALRMAEYLARVTGARLVLTTRSDVPFHQYLDADVETLCQLADADRERLRKLRALQDAGAELLVVTADVRDPEQMREAFRQASARFGSVNGVIHTAAELGEGAVRTLDEASREDCARQFGAKIQGALVLADVIDGLHLDFCLLTSSLAAVLGGLGYAAYAASNIFQDVHARQLNRRAGTRWLTVNWDIWQPDDGKRMGESLADLPMLPAEGIEAFDRLLAHAHWPQIIVSTGDLNARIRQWVLREGFEGNQDDDDGERVAYDRSELGAAYVAPENDIEHVLAAIWEQAFGFDRIGTADNFFDLGGHSLLAVRINSAARDTFGVEIPIRALFETPTIAAIGRKLVGLGLDSGVDVIGIAALLREVSGLSADEVEALLEIAEQPAPLLAEVNAR